MEGVEKGRKGGKKVTVGRWRGRAEGKASGASNSILHTAVALNSIAGIQKFYLFSGPSQR